MPRFKLGDKIERLYQYEVRKKPSGELYAHILDGSKFHLKMSEIGSDFKLIN